MGCEEDAHASGIGSQSIALRASIVDGKENVRRKTHPGRLPLSVRSALAFIVPRARVKSDGYRHRDFIFDNPGRFHDHYTIDERIGKGQFGIVSRVTSKHGGAVRAVKKCYKVRDRDAANLSQEITIMKLLDHPNIIRLYETFQDHRCAYFVMELCTGGELLSAITASGSFSEFECVLVLTQVFRGVCYMHGKNVCHRDIKPENFLLKDACPLASATVKIVDFGVSAQVFRGTFLEGRAGTPAYIAPEVLDGKYNELCDIWSCGVVTFFLLSGALPFDGRSEAEIFQRIKEGSWQLAADVADEAKNLVTNCLQKEPVYRFTAHQALGHSWLLPQIRNREVCYPTSLVVGNMKRFHEHSRLKKAALHSAAMLLDVSALKELMAAFNALDVDCDGRLSPSKIKDGLSDQSVSGMAEHVLQMMADIDTDGDGFVDFTEFLASAMDAKLLMQEDICWEAFRVFDRDGDGMISPEELEQVLGENAISEMVHNPSVESLIRDTGAGTSPKGFISFEEFKTMLRCG